ncbi:MAG: BON domain-containing protein [Desulfovibrionaceae bacterium]|nr:BON domain-containing protein [Desulfovibrionaceae bacterium]
MHKRALCLLFLVLFFLHGCSAYSIYDDKRLLDTMTNDKALATSIKTALVKKNFSGGLAISVYCYYRHVFLIGQIPPHLQDVALHIAQSKNPRSVTTHWFDKATAADSDFILASRLRAALIGTKGLSSTRIDTEVNAGRVVLLGVVESEAERKLALRTARHIDGVVKLTSYLLIPPKAEDTIVVPEREDAVGKNPHKKQHHPDEVPTTQEEAPQIEEKAI